MENFLENDDHLESLFTNHQKDQLQSLDLEMYSIQTTKPSFCLPPLHEIITYINSPNTKSRKIDPTQNILTIIPGPTTQASCTTKEKVPTFLQIDGT